MKRIALGFAAAFAFAFATAATASSFGPIPVNYESEAAAYVAERMGDPRGAKYEAVSEPYQVFADVSGYEGLPCWAVDLRVKSRLPSGGVGMEILTVVFLEGRAIALKDDAQRLVRA